MERRIAAALVLTSMAGGVASVAAQELPTPRVYLGVSLVGADAVGELEQAVDQGFGGQVWAAVPVLADGLVRLRGELDLVVYGHERLGYCFSLPVGCRVGLDVTTTNSIVSGGVGPELVFAAGRLEPYAFGTVGFAYFSTTSSVSDDSGGEAFANSTNFDDVVGAWTVGGGLRVRVRGGEDPIHLDVGLERHQNGIASYLTEGGIVDNPDGSITLLPFRSEANLVSFRLGVSFGISPDRD